MEPFVNLFGPVDAVLAPYVEYFVFGLVLINLVTRHLAHRRHVAQVRDGADAVDRYLPHVASNVLLVLGSFYYLTIAQKSGIILSMFAIGVFVADFFEFESRNVEARNDMPIERPKAAIVGSLLTLAYAGFLAFYWVIAGPWESIV
jgi:hypothetical protein